MERGPAPQEVDQGGEQRNKYRFHTGNATWAPTEKSTKSMSTEFLVGTTPNEPDIAKRVFLSSRMLQRKLAEEGTNFRTLLLEVRRELAEKYISDKHMPLAEITYMLGFSDVSSFSRAFKKWTGDPPAAFRSNLG